jgi:hypothetical protein
MGVRTRTERTKICAMTRGHKPIYEWHWTVRKPG